MQPSECDRMGEFLIAKMILIKKSSAQMWLDLWQIQTVAMVMVSGQTEVYKGK